MIRTLFIKAYRYRFEFLLCSILMVFLTNILLPEDIFNGTPQLVYLPFQFFAAVNLFRNKRKAIFKVLFYGGIITVVGRLVGIFEDIGIDRYFALSYVVFFGAVVVELFRQMMKAEVVSRKIVVAAICGLLMIGYTSYFVFMTVEFFYPESFSGLAEGPARFRDLFYYSYVTLMTIGYGDISPATWVAKNATLLCALTGYIYSIVVVAVIVGRFSSNQIKK